MKKFVNFLIVGAEDVMYVLGVVSVLASYFAVWFYTNNGGIDSVGSSGWVPVAVAMYALLGVMYGAIEFLPHRSISTMGCIGLIIYLFLVGMFATPIWLTGLLIVSSRRVESHLKVEVDEILRRRRSYG